MDFLDFIPIDKNSQGLLIIQTLEQAGTGNKQLVPTETSLAPKINLEQNPSIPNVTNHVTNTQNTNTQNMIFPHSNVTINYNFK